MTELNYVALAVLSVSVLAIGREKLRIGPHRTKLQPTFNPPVTARPEPRVSMAQFDQMTRDKTRAQIEDEYGPPDDVNDNGDSWLYYNLEIYDEDLGNRMTARVRFAGIGGPRDFAVVVEFW